MKAYINSFTNNKKIVDLGKQTNASFKSFLLKHQRASESFADNYMDAQFYGKPLNMTEWKSISGGMHADELKKVMDAMPAEKKKKALQSSQALMKALIHLRKESNHERLDKWSDFAEPDN